MLQAADISARRDSQYGMILHHSGAFQNAITGISMYLSIALLPGSPSPSHRGMTQNLRQLVRRGLFGNGVNP